MIVDTAALIAPLTVADRVRSAARSTMSSRSHSVAIIIARGIALTRRAGMVAAGWYPIKVARRLWNETHGMSPRRSQALRLPPDAAAASERHPKSGCSKIVTWRPNEPSRTISRALATRRAPARQCETQLACHAARALLAHAACPSLPTVRGRFASSYCLPCQVGVVHRMFLESARDLWWALFFFQRRGSVLKFGDFNRAHMGRDQPHDLPGLTRR